MKSKILITGGAGYIGSKFANECIAQGHDVVIVDNLSEGSPENIHEKAKFYQEDITSSHIFSIFKKEMPDMIYHLAALKNTHDSLKNQNRFAEVNIIGSLNILNFANLLGIKKIIFPSTAGVYGNAILQGLQSEEQPDNPSSPYACSKLAIEKYIHYFNTVQGMEAIVLRFSNVYGPGGKTTLNSVIHIFIENMLENKPIEIYGDGEQTRDFIYIDDIVSMFMHLSKIPYADVTKEYIFNVGTGEKTSINQAVALITRKLQCQPKVIFRQSMFYGQKESVLNPKKVNDIFHWKAAVPLTLGIEKTIAYLQEEMQKKYRSSL